MKEETISKPKPALNHPIEQNFNWAFISKLALRESWRKEVYRPPLHLHPWWAVRLGSVFRALVIASLGDGRRLEEVFYDQNLRLSGVVLDPFMGAGTTLLEALKLGARVVGADINPVSHFAARQALTPVNPFALRKEFHRLEEGVGKRIRRYYRTLDRETGEEIPLLYTLWVKVVHTPEGEEVPLFKSYVFAKNAIPSKKPVAHGLCPECGAIFSLRYDDKRARCPSCGHSFNPQRGPVRPGGKVETPSGKVYRIIDLLPGSRPPEHRMFALIAWKNGRKVYLPPSPFDRQVFQEAVEEFFRLRDQLPLPRGELLPGHNTDQARRYGYRKWEDFFNPRQLLTLGLLLREILSIEEEAVRDSFLALFSAILEFNNLFCTYKGEGTGAVRPLFSHHILKPEFVVLENSVWGQKNSSGTFASLFERRLLRAKEYLLKPYEVGPDGKKYPLRGIATRFAPDTPSFVMGQGNALLFCGDSAKLALPKGFVDAVITDPPYGDFVNYSELADFFFSWQHHFLGGVQEDLSSEKTPTTRSPLEVQSQNLDIFSQNLQRVFLKVHEVLKEDGLLVFTYHHSRDEGWKALARALWGSGFVVRKVYPVYGEMAVSKTKYQTEEPIHLDMVLVCRKKRRGVGPRPSEVLEEFITTLNALQEFFSEQNEKRKKKYKARFSRGDRFILEWAFALYLFSSLAGSSGGKIGGEEIKLEPGLGEEDPATQGVLEKYLSLIPLLATSAGSESP